MSNAIPELVKGDTLLYGPHDLFGFITCIKTWSDVCHVEIYAGEGMSVASRNGIGVNLYPFRRGQLKHVRRPIQSFNFQAAMDWFNKMYNPVTGEGIRGQRYDWLGLLCFTLAVKQGAPNKMFCSEFWTRFYRAGGLDVVAKDFDSDKVAPGNCRMTPVLETIWNRSSLV